MSSATTTTRPGAWGDYSGRILELEVRYNHFGEEASSMVGGGLCELLPGR
jgi:hypothetical protein